MRNLVTTLYRSPPLTLFKCWGIDLKTIGWVVGIAQVQTGSGSNWDLCPANGFQDVLRYRCPPAPTLFCFTLTGSGTLVLSLNLCTLVLSSIQLHPRTIWSAPSAVLLLEFVQSGMNYILKKCIQQTNISRK
jgi:hypothetical protein